MGFGHRVYKNFDPRATILRKMAGQVLEELGINDPLLEIARNLEKVALEDDYFVSRKLYPNVDFYSGILYRAMGIPTNMFTVMFAIGRLPGWLLTGVNSATTTRQRSIDHDRSTPVRRLAITSQSISESSRSIQGGLAEPLWINALSRPRIVTTNQSEEHRTWH